MCSEVSIYLNNIGARRAFVEPPMPGYTGYIPRIRPTDLGLGLSYHQAAKKGLNRFAVESTYSISDFPTSTVVTTETE